MVWNPDQFKAENKEMAEMEKADPFLSASKRNLTKILPPKMPSELEIEKLTE